MSVEKRNFWIVLTLFAVLATGISVMKKLRHRDMREMRIEQFSRHGCDSWKDNLRNKKLSNSWDSREEKRPLIERKRRHCRPNPDASDFYLPDQLPVPKNYDLIWNEARDRHEGPGGTLVVRVRVDEQGRYVEHRMLKSAHAGLRYSVETLLPQLDFIPAYHQGEAVQAWVNIPFQFSATN